jgi:elongation of very long chain fatty acids protein 7
LFADDRTKDWFLVGSPLVPMAIVYIYLKIVREWAPKHMENRQPYDLKRTLLVYNIVQVILSVYLFYEVGTILSLFSAINEIKIIFCLLTIYI